MVLAVTRRHYYVFSRTRDCWGNDR